MTSNNAIKESGRWYIANTRFNTWTNLDKYERRLALKCVPGYLFQRVFLGVQWSLFWSKPWLHRLYRSLYYEVIVKFYVVRLLWVYIMGSQPQGRGLVQKLF